MQVQVSRASREGRCYKTKVQQKMVSVGVCTWPPKVELLRPCLCCLCCQSSWKLRRKPFYLQLQWRWLFGCVENNSIVYKSLLWHRLSLYVECMSDSKRHWGRVSCGRWCTNGAGGYGTRQTFMTISSSKTCTWVPNSSMFWVAY